MAGPLGPLFAGAYPFLLISVGIGIMCFAGVRYWGSDPIRFLVTPPWDSWHRLLFRPPGYSVYLLGCILSLAGPAMLVFRWFANQGLMR